MVFILPTCLFDKTSVSQNKKLRNSNFLFFMAIGHKFFIALILRLLSLTSFARETLVKNIVSLKELNHV